MATKETDFFARLANAETALHVNDWLSSPGLRTPE
jgi:hypothetical protein